MFKKLLCVICVILSILLFISCGTSKNTMTSKNTTINSIKNTKDENNTSYNTNVQSPSPTVTVEPRILYILKKSIHPSLPKYIFKLYGQQDDLSSTVTKIIIFTNTDNKKAVQEILVEDSDAPNSLGTAGVSIEDVNFDGYKDIMVQGTGASGPNIPFSFWLWDNSLSKFVPSEELNGLLSPEIDYDHKTIISTNSSCAGGYYTESYYQFIDEKFTLVKEIERTADIKLKVFKYTVKKRINNKMKVVKEYSEPYEY